MPSVIVSEEAMVDVRLIVPVILYELVAELHVPGVTLRASVGATTVTDTVMVVWQVGVLVTLTTNVLIPAGRPEVVTVPAFVGVMVTLAGPLQA